MLNYLHEEGGNLPLETASLHSQSAKFTSLEGDIKWLGHNSEGHSVLFLDSFRAIRQNPRNLCLFIDTLYCDFCQWNCLIYFGTIMKKNNPVIISTICKSLEKSDLILRCVFSSKRLTRWERERKTYLKITF